MPIVEREAIALAIRMIEEKNSCIVIALWLLMGAAFSISNSDSRNLTKSLKVENTVKCSL